MSTAVAPPLLRGERLALRPMTFDDLPHLMRWGSDPEFRRYQWGREPGRFEEDDARRWIERMSRPGDSACWIIEYAGRAVGFANYRNYHPKGRSAEIGIGIGEPGLWGKHLGREAVGVLVRYLFDELQLHRVGQQLPFAVIRKRDGVLVGTTRYAHIDPPNRTLEIGYTFYGKGARRTPVNTESKLLLLRHAFETLGANRVWLQTDKRNEPSQNAIARLGAQKEAELRNERVLPDGRLRTSVVFGITRDDWPSVQTRLLSYLER